MTDIESAHRALSSDIRLRAAADVQRFERDGYVVVRQAFARADGLAMERRWWRELEGTHGIRAGDRSSWRQIRGDLKAAAAFMGGETLVEGVPLRVVELTGGGLQGPRP